MNPNMCSRVVRHACPPTLGGLVKTRKLSVAFGAAFAKKKETGSVGEVNVPSTGDLDRSDGVILPGSASDDSRLSLYREYGSIVRQPMYTGWSDFEGITGDEDPLERIKKYAKYEKVRMGEDVKNLASFEFESKLEEFTFGTVYTDVLIIGGGAIGSACAYWLKEKVRDGLSVTVVERDPKYRMSTTCLTIDGLKQRYSLKENIAMASYGADFIRSADHFLRVPGVPKLDFCFEPHGYLLLASEESAEDLSKISELQNAIGGRNLLMAPHRLKSMFPWLNTEDVALGCLGLGKEGWFDPWALTVGFRTKAMYFETEYLAGEVVGFRFQNTSTEHVVTDDHFRNVRVAVVRRPNGDLTFVNFSICVVAAGAESGLVSKLMGMGTGTGIMRVPLPVMRKKRHLYCFHSSNAPRLNTPIVADYNGITFRRDGLGGYYMVGVSPKTEVESPRGDTRVNYKLFFDYVLPQLVHRVPDFEKATLRAAWAGNYEHNTVDANGIIGRHPMFSNVIFACGFSEHGIHFAPAVGRAVSELVLEDDFTTIDLTRFSFARIFKSQEVHETKIK